MTNREIVIKGLECHKDPCGPCTDCPYNDSKRDCAYSLCEDALKLLKEQQETISSFQGTIHKLNAALEERNNWLEYSAGLVLCRRGKAVIG